MLVKLASLAFQPTRIINSQTVLHFPINQLLNSRWKVFFLFSSLGGDLKSLSTTPRSGHRVYFATLALTPCSWLNWKGIATRKVPRCNLIKSRSRTILVRNFLLFSSNIFSKYLPISKEIVSLWTIWKFTVISWGRYVLRCVLRNVRNLKIAWIIMNYFTLLYYVLKYLLIHVMSPLAITNISRKIPTQDTKDNIWLWCFSSK